MIRVIVSLGLLAFSQSAGMISGQIANSTSNAPVSAARLLLVPVDGSIASSTLATSDASGRFTFRDVADGRYRLFAEHAGFLRGEHDGPIAVSPSQRVVDATVVLTPTGVISGTIVSEFGEPAIGVYVRASTATGLPLETRTDDRGAYRLFDLPAGKYIVSAERYLAPRIGEASPRIPGVRYIVPTPPCPDCMGEGQGMMALPALLAQGAFIDARALTGESSLAVFYPQTTDKTAAQPIDLRAGAEISGIDLRLIVRR